MTKIVLLVAYLVFIAPIAIALSRLPADTGFPGIRPVYLSPTQPDLFRDYLPSVVDTTSPKANEKEKPNSPPPFDTAAKVFNPQAVLP